MFKSISKISITVLIFAGFLHADVPSGVTGIVSNQSGGGFDFNSLKNLINTEKEDNSFSFGNDFLKAKCSFKNSDNYDLGNTDICDTIGKNKKNGGNGFADKLSNYLNKRYDVFGFGTCSIKTKKQQDLEEFCKQAEKDTKDVLEKAKKQGKYDVKNIPDDIKIGTQSPTKIIMPDSNRNLGITGGERHQTSKNGGVLKQTNQHGETVGEAMDNQAFIYANLQTEGSVSSDSAMNVMMRCLKQFPATKNKDELKIYMDLCSPSNQKRGAESENYEKVVETSKILSSEQSPDYAKTITMQSKITSDLSKTYKCAEKKTLKEAKECEQQYFQNTQDENSGAGASSAMLADYIKTIEEASAMQISAIEEAYPFEFLYTSQEVLEGILPNKRSYYLDEFQKQDMKSALFYSYAKQISEAKKELAKLSFAKIQECSTPFYYEAVLNDINKMTDEAKKEAKKIVDKILTDNTGSITTN